MNCKPNDLAVYVGPCNYKTCEVNIGRVFVVGQLLSGDDIDRLGIHPDMAPVWTLPFATTRWASGKEHPYVPDAMIRPIRPPKQTTDENTTEELTA